MSKPNPKRVPIPAVLVLENNRTYGRSANKKRLLYKCIPNDSDLPPILVPYEISVGFSKQFVNKFVTIQIDEECKSSGMIAETIGDVDDLSAFCEYRLKCKQVNCSCSPMNQRINQHGIKNLPTMFHSILVNRDYNIADRTHEAVFAIDPIGSRDFDDAFSVRQIDDTMCIVSVHIANVALWVDALDLWPALRASGAVSTVYLPDRRRPVFPTILSEHWMSLVANENRLALTMDFAVSNGHIIDSRLTNTCICVKHNFVYESADMHRNEKYQILVRNTPTQDAGDSHDVVAYWMTQMNARCGEMLAECGVGIFRQAIRRERESTSRLGSTPNPNEHSPDVRRFIENWASMHAEYVHINNALDPDITNTIEHAGLNLHNYVHITSPIRRLVDILNQFMILTEYDICRLGSSVSVSDFSVGRINEQTRAIKNVQMECDTLHKITTSPEIVDREHEGIIIDICDIGVYGIQYTVYIESLRLVVRVKTTESSKNENIEMYSKHKFRVYVFNHEYKMRRKIRWRMC